MRKSDIITAIIQLKDILRKKNWILSVPFINIYIFIYLYIHKFLV